MKFPTGLFLLLFCNIVIAGQIPLDFEWEQANCGPDCFVFVETDPCIDLFEASCLEPEGILKKSLSVKKIRKDLNQRVEKIYDQVVSFSGKADLKGYITEELAKIGIGIG
ncbi:MAG: hypothetical protein HOE90_19095 [Bacteriovoracaceae bacterium]|jgi:hypothetical protein|nr:hypothetical protein [Bacteriovoracaceae bacterium]